MNELILSEASSSRLFLARLAGEFEKHGQCREQCGEVYWSVGDAVSFEGTAGGGVCIELLHPPRSARLCSRSCLRLVASLLPPRSTWRRLLWPPSNMVACIEKEGRVSGHSTCTH